MHEDEKEEEKIISDMNSRKLSEQKLHNLQNLFDTKLKTTLGNNNNKNIPPEKNPSKINNFNKNINKMEKNGVFKFQENHSSNRHYNLGEIPPKKNLINDNVDSKLSKNDKLNQNQKFGEK